MLPAHKTRGLYKTMRDSRFRKCLSAGRKIRAVHLTVRMADYAVCGAAHMARQGFLRRAIRQENVRACRPKHASREAGLRGAGVPPAVFAGSHRLESRRRDAGATKYMRGKFWSCQAAQRRRQFLTVADQVRIRNVSSSFYNSNSLSVAQ
jgi:hypothetical protein